MHDTIIYIDPSAHSPNVALWKSCILLNLIWNNAKMMMDAAAYIYRGEREKVIRSRYQNQQQQQCIGIDPATYQRSQ